MSSSERRSHHPVEVAYLPVVRCAVCRRTVAHRPGQASAVLTRHYQRAHPEMLTAEWLRRVDAYSADVGAGQLAPVTHARRTEP
jgi:hypothetical protein